MSIYELGPLGLDTGTGVLTRGGAPLPLGPRAIAVLTVLVERHGECVPKATILDIAWHGTTVEESNLAVQVSSIRKLLAQVPGGARWIETVPWRGYRYRGPVAQAPTAASGSGPLTQPRNNLVTAKTSFIGRKRERGELRDRLSRARVLTLVGTGGIGKTRLALEIAADSRHAFPDGTWVVELASITDPRFVPGAIASVLGVRDTGTQPLPDALRKHLQSRHTLLVVDNCEQVRDAIATLVGTIVKDAPQVTVIATSREPLGIASEQVYGLEPLSLPAADADPEAIGQAEAVRLFVARARAQQADFTLSAARAVTVAQVCTDLDGIPLALELAAARIHSLSIEQIGARLGDRFRLLTTTQPAVPRQQTLRAAMDWSHDLLAEDERIVLRRMAIFAGGCTSEAVAAVTSDPAIDAHAAVDVLARLARRSLVNVATRASGARYRLLETTRAYALEKLDEAGETAAARYRHAEYFHALVADGYLEWFHMSDAAWHERYAPELDNVRAALAWAFAEGDAPIAIGLAATASQLLLSTLAQRSEARGWIEMALARFDGQASDRQRAQLWLASAVSAEISSLTLVNDTYARAIELLRRAGDREGLAYALACGAYSLVYEHRLDDAEAALCEAAPLLAGTDRIRSLIPYFGATASLAAARGDDRASMAASEKAIELCRSVGADRSGAMLLSNQGETLWLAGDLDRAEASLRESAMLLRTLPDMANSSAMCICLVNLVGVLVAGGFHDEALDVAAEALPLAVENNLAPPLLDHLALRAALAGRHDDAARLAGYSDARHEAVGMVRQRSELRARERMQALLRDALPGAGAKRLAAEGAAMSPSEAEALALRA